MIDVKKLAEILNEGEHQRLEFKSVAPKGATIERVVLGMANTQGGTLLLGIRDNGTVAGLKEAHVKRGMRAINRLQQDYPEIQVAANRVSIHGKAVVSVLIEPVASAADQVADRSGRVWHRFGATTQQASPHERVSLSVEAVATDSQVHRSRHRMPFGALRVALQNLRNRCGYPDCEVSDPLEVVAISSLVPGGPRFESTLFDEQRFSLDNFLLMCPNHHVVVDRDSSTCSIEWMHCTRRAWVEGGSELVHPTTPPPSCFLSYAWENDEHIQWVGRLASDLRSQMGVAVLLDSWALRPGDSITQFMENAVEDSDFVAMVLTPSYARRVKTREGGVGYEGGIVTGAMLEGRDPRRSVPLLRGEPSDSIPAFLKGRMYIDLRDDQGYLASLEELARAIHDAPRMTPPAIGGPPWGGTS